MFKIANFKQISSYIGELTRIPREFEIFFSRPVETKIQVEFKILHGTYAGNLFGKIVKYLISSTKRLRESPHY
jgi:hypothetical protein